MTNPELWRHEQPQSTQMWKFMQHVNSKFGLKLNDYPSLYKWSVNNVPEFWGEVWHFVGIKSSKSFDQVGALLLSVLLLYLSLFAQLPMVSRVSEDNKVMLYWVD